MLFESEPIYQLLRTLVSIIGALGMQAAVTVFRPTAKRNLLLFCAYMVYCFLLCAFLISMSGLLLLIKIIPFAIVIPGICIFYMVADVPLSQYVFTASTQIILSSYVMGSVTLINIRQNSSPLTHILCLVLTYLLVILLELVFLRRIYLQITATMKQGWEFLSVIPCALFVLVSAFACYPVHYTRSSSGTILVYALGAAIIVIYVAIFSFLKVRNDLSIQERNREILELQLQNIRKNTADSKRKAEIAKKTKQDAFILLSGIADLVKAGNWEAIHEAVDKETTKNDSSAYAGYCSDPILNATLDSYLGRAKNSGITVETSLNLPKTLPDCCTEFSICLANALENAIKACEKLPKNERKIIVKCTGNPKLMFKMVSRYAPYEAYPYIEPNVRFSRIRLPTKRIVHSCPVNTDIYLRSCQRIDLQHIIECFPCVTYFLTAPIEPVE